MRRPIGVIFRHRAAADAARQHLIDAGIGPDDLDLELLPIPAWDVLEGFGIPSEVARLYEPSIQGGDWLLVVRGERAHDPAIREIVTREGGLMVAAPPGETPPPELEIGD